MGLKNFFKLCILFCSSSFIEHSSAKLFCKHLFSPTRTQRAADAPLASQTESSVQRQAEIRLENDLRAIRNSRQEPLLKRQGFKPSYYKGVDQAREFKRVQKYLQEIKADPEETHIAYFADQAIQIIDKVSKELRENNANGNLLKKALDLLENFKTEAQSRMEDQKATYDWWSNFNYRLVILASLASSRTGGKLRHPRYSDPYFWRTHKGMQEFIDYHLHLIEHQKQEYPQSEDVVRFHEIKEKFPEETIFFTSDEIGIMALNRAGKKFYFVGVSGGPRTVDGMDLIPIIFFEHDLAHAKATTDIFSQEIVSRIDRLPKKSDREKAELALFIHSHEDGADVLQSVWQMDSSSLRKVMLRLVNTDEQKPSETFMKGISNNAFRGMMTQEIRRFLDPLDLRGILPDPVDTANKKEIESFLKESADVFSNIVLMDWKYFRGLGDTVDLSFNEY